MNRLAHLLGFSGKIDRTAFITGMAGAVVLFWLGVQGSLGALPWMAEVLAPRGVNAAFALNAIWLALGAGLSWMTAALFAKRLRARGRSPWWAAAVVVPPALLALLNDAIFLVSRTIAVAPAINLLLIAAATVVALGVAAECLRPAEEQV